MKYHGQMLKLQKIYFMEDKLRLIAKTFGEEKFKFNEPLKYYTALKIGGKAKALFVAFTNQEIIKLITACRNLNVPFFIFGTGTKIAFSDHGFDGLVIKNRTRNIQTISVKGRASRLGIGVQEAIIEVDSGVSLDKFIEFLEKDNLSSEDFKGIPGSIGGALFISKILQSRAKSIKVLDLESEVEEIDPNQLSLSKHIILSGVFKIKAKI